MTEYHPYESLLPILRLRRSLEGSDDSEDSEIAALSPKEAFIEVCIFHFGEKDWGDAILQWMAECGLTVSEYQEATPLASEKYQQLQPERQ